MNEVEKRRLIDNVAGLPEAAVGIFIKRPAPPMDRRDDDVQALNPGKPGIANN